ncbi:MAG: HEAT repeat domain-containing protein [Rhodothermales bacterium]
MSHDPEGRIYVTETNRRRTEDLDIRFIPGLEPIPWSVLDQTFQTVEDRRDAIHTFMAPGAPYRNPWLKDRDGNGVTDWRDLTTLTERVNLLEDTDGDGTADRATVFAEGFQTEVTGVAAGVLWHEGNVYLTLIPDLWLLKDTDGDRVADERTVLQSGHGVHMGLGGHDLHGLTVGPDGRIYWSIGDKGVHFTTREGRTIRYPHEGLVLRSEPDGSHVEVFAHGLRNCLEISFDTYGRLFCMDNDGDLPGERERFVYITRGSDSGWRSNWQYNMLYNWTDTQRLPHYLPWMDERLFVPAFDGQAAYITPPLANYSDGPAGFLFNPGTALNAAYRDYVFITQFPGKKISAFQVKPRGAGFEMVNEHTFYEGFMATGLSFGPDGALYVADWSGEWAPNESGAIVKIDFPEEADSPARRRTRQYIQAGMNGRPDSELIDLLAYPDQRVRLNAQFELVRRKQGETLAGTVFDSGADPLARIHALWGMGQLARSGDLHVDRAMRSLFDDADLEVRRQAIRLAGEHPALFPDSEADLVRLLGDPDDRTRYEAALSLGSCGTAGAVPALFALLERNADRDAFIRHAAVSSLASLATTDQLVGAGAHASLSVRIGAVVALRRQRNPGVASFLKDASERVVVEAARAIHDDESIPDALPDLAALAGVTPFRSEALLRRVLNAGLRLGREEDIERLFAAAEDASYPDVLRAEALEMLATWTRPVFLDRVEHRYRPLPDRPGDAVARRIENRMSSLFATRSSTVLAAALHLLEVYRIAPPDAQLMEWLADESRPAGMRIDVLDLLLPTPAGAGALDAALQSQAAPLRIAAMKRLAERDEAAASRHIRRLFDRPDAVAEQQAALGILAGLAGPDARHILSEMATKYLNNNEIDPIDLDLFLALRASGDPALGKRADEVAARFDGAEAPYAFSLEGGDATRGEALFTQHAAAQCIRCHAVGGEGSRVGPDLEGVGRRRDRAYLLESLIAPSAKIAPGYETLTITLADGGVVSGSLADESADSLRLRVPGNEVRVFAQNDIRKRTAPAASMMPPMGALLRPLELRDLVAYLASLQ